MEEARAKKKKGKRIVREIGPADKVAEMPEPSTSGLSEVERQLMDATREDLSSNSSSFTRLSTVDLQDSHSSSCTRLSAVASKDSTDVDSLCTELTDFTPFGLGASKNVESVIESRSMPERTGTVENNGNEIPGRSGLMGRRRSEMRAVVMEYFIPTQNSKSVKPYVNPLLGQNINFEHAFNDSQKLPSGRCPNTILKDLLFSYADHRRKLALKDMQIVSALKQSKELQSDMWTLSRTLLMLNGECQDGNPVSATAVSETANFSEVNHSQLKQISAEIRCATEERESINYEVEITRQHILAELANYFDPCVDGINPNIPRIQLQPDAKSFQGSLECLRSCITTLFFFLRNFQEDPEFCHEVETWITRLNALLLFMGTTSDFVFMLLHVLRCPPNLNNNIARLIQVPITTDVGDMHLHDPLIAHAVAMLGVLLNPINQRDLYLEKLQFDFNSSWVILEMEGESGTVASCMAITEEDLNKLLNQIPLEKIFREIYNLKSERQSDGTMKHSIDRSRPYDLTDMEGFLGLSVFLVGLFERGLQTYNKKCYKQFAKKLCCYIAHVVKHVTNIWEHSLSHQEADFMMWSELHGQYDTLVETAIQAIFSSRSLGAWQFLTTLPYTRVSIECLWNLYYKLHQTATQEFTRCIPVEEARNADLVQMFGELKDSVPDDDMYYLLSTFASMALECSKRLAAFSYFNSADTEFVFVERVIVDLVKVGLIHEATRDSYLKSCRTLLANLATEIPCTLSIILATVASNLDIAGEDAFYLFQGLPLSTWFLQTSDLEILDRWLCEMHLLSTEHNLARLIFVNLNYGFHSGELYLGHETHCSIAFILVEAVTNLAPEPNRVQSTIATVSNFVRNKGLQTTFKSWAWDLILRLRLHCLDLVCSYDPSIVFSVEKTQTKLAAVPHIYGSLRLQGLCRSVMACQPLACYVAVLISEWGHSVPEICERGFKHLFFTLTFSRYLATLVALQHIVPLFAECPESLAKSEKFLSVLLSLLIADKNYIKMARNLVSNQIPINFVRLYQMVTVQLKNHAAYNLSSPAPLVRAWFECLVLLPNWNSEQSVIRFMDVILSVVQTHPRAISEARDVLRKYIVCGSTRPQPSTTGTSSASWMGWMSSPNPFAHMLMQTATNSNAVWFAALAIDVEEGMQQKVWRETLNFLANGLESNIESAVKKAAACWEGAAPVPAALAIYRWANQALVTETDHPLLPYLWQRFFSLYLQRATNHDQMMPAAGVGDKFFMGKNAVLLKNVTERLKMCEEFFDKKVALNPDNDLFTKCQRLYQTFSLWIAEPRLFEYTLQLPSLPIVYDAPKLAQIFKEEKDIWMEYLDVASMKITQELAEQAWDCSCHRVKDNPISVCQRSDNGAPLDCLVQRLETYGRPLEPAKVELKPDSTVPMKKAFIDYKYLMNPSEIMDFEDNVERFKMFCWETLDQAMKAIRSEAKVYEFRMQEHCALDSELLELLRQLYQNCQREISVQAGCHSTPRHEHRTCAGPATLRFLVNEAHIAEAVRIEIEANRERSLNVYQAITSRMDPKVGFAFQQFTSFFSEFMRLYFEEGASTGSEWRQEAIKTFGLEAFKYIMTKFTEDLSSYPPSRIMFTTQLPLMANAIVLGNSNMIGEMIETMLQHEHVLQVLSSYLVPSEASSTAFLDMYYRVVNSMGTRKSSSVFVCLAKFDIKRWLQSVNTFVNSRSLLLNFIFSTLNNVGPRPPDDIVMILELMVSHAMVILSQTFPEHFGEVLNHLLEGSAKQTLKPSMWTDFLQALMTPEQSVHFSALATTRAQMHYFAASQTGIQSLLLVETAKVLNHHFILERQQFGLHGLYPKYLEYISALMKFICAIMSRLVVATLNEDCGSPNDVLCNVIWPSIELVFWPWIAPCALLQPSPEWIEQLSNRPMLMPWTTTHEFDAKKVVGGLTDLIHFILETLPGCGTPLNYLWHWYSTRFANVNVTDTVLSVIHQHWSLLPWTRFYPTTADMKSILTILLEPLPSCHAFISTVYVSVKWNDWMGQVMFGCDNETVTVLHTCYLHSVVKLSKEKIFQESPLALEMVKAALAYSWHTVDAVAYSKVLDTWLALFEPKVTMSTASSTLLEGEVFKLLSVAAPLGDKRKQLLHPTAMHKRVLFVRTAMKMLSQSTTSHKTAADKFPFFLFNGIEDAVASRGTTRAQEVEDCKLLVREVLVYANRPGNPLSDALIAGLVEWIKRKDARSVVLKTVLSLVVTDLVERKISGDIMEASLETFFKQKLNYVNLTVTPSWDWVSPLLPAVPSVQLEESLLSNGHFLSFYALHYKRQNVDNAVPDLDAESIALKRMLEILKKRDVRLPEDDAKLVLMWSICLKTIQLQAQTPTHAPAAKENLRLVIMYLTEESTKKFDPWSFLGTIGFSKSGSPSLPYRTLSRVMAVYLLAQMPDFKGTIVLRRNEDDPGAVVPLVDVENGPVPTNEAKKGVRDLEQLAEHKTHSELKPVTLEAITAIKNCKNTLMETNKILGILANKYFHNLYLMCLKD